MKTRNILLAAVAVALVWGCASRRSEPAPSGTDRYRRAPIREVSEASLKSDSRLIDALTLQETGHMNEALEAFARLTHDEPTMAAAWYEQGQLLLQRGWTDSALHCAQRAVELQGDNQWYLLALAQTCQRAGNTALLTATWERLVALQPDVAEYYFELSNAYLRANDATGAIGALNRLERRVGVTESVSLQKQRIWEAIGKHDKALREMEALAEALPREKRYQAILAQMNMQQKNYKKARLYYDRILTADPDDEYIHVQLAEYHKQLGHKAEADSEMVLAFANPRLDAASKLQILTSFYTEEEFYGSRRDICFRLLEMVVQQGGDPSQTALFYADMLMRQERYDEAATQFSIALQSDSSRYEVWEVLLVCLSEVPAREDEMADRARRAARLFPIHTLPHYLVGLYEMRHEHYDAAVEALQPAVKWGFSKGYLEAETYSLLAECHYRAGRFDRCWEAFDQLLKVQPDNMMALNNYAYYLAEQNHELERAEKMSRRTIEAQPDNANNLDTYAWILHLLGRDAEALPYMKKAVSLDPQSDTLRQHLSEIEQNLPPSAKSRNP